ncbi:hypothetical protein [Streptomyces prunicolor]|uniref:hypothetical protein n=1 Tax=Streptomyces prunicolor TaxID=67348 RepID=UPI0033F05405
MTLEVGLEDSGAIPKVNVGSCVPHVRDKEDVPHEHALPDLYGLGKIPSQPGFLRRGVTLSQFLASVEAERKARAELLELVGMCTEMQCREDEETFGLLVIHTQAKPVGALNYVVEYCDVIMSDRMGDEGHARLRLVEAHAAAAGAMELERESFDRPHAQLDGSNSFKIIRYGRVLA